MTEVGNNEDSTSNATAWSSTWGWSKNPGLVHAFPNAKLDTALLPLMLRNLASLAIDVSWSYEGGSSATGNNDFDSLRDLGAKANVAVDMFFDSDSSNAVTTTKSAYEVMVWLGSFGEVVPIGFTNGVRANKTVSSSEL
jgi:xyloglucan-specific endo-beta-1,4-glucanase